MGATGQTPFIDQAGNPVVVEVDIGHHKHAALVADLGANPATAVIASRQVLGGGDVRRLLGWSIRETSGAATATFRLRDGNNAAAVMLANANLAANESIRDFWFPAGILVATGRIYLEIVSGSVEGVLYYLP